MNMVFIILNIFLILSSFLSNYFVTLQFAIVNSLALFVTMRFRIGEPTKINVAATTINSVPHGTLFSVFNLSWWIWMRHLQDVNCSAPFLGDQDPNLMGHDLGKLGLLWFCLVM